MFISNTFWINACRMFFGRKLHDLHIVIKWNLNAHSAIQRIGFVASVIMFFVLNKISMGKVS
jgi:hypothetical protein